MSIKNSIFKYKPYNGIRLRYKTFVSGDETFYYSEGDGNRYYFNIFGSTDSENMEASTFNSFLSFTTSNYVVREFEAIPMEPGDTVFIESTATAVNSDTSKAFLCKTFGGFRHNGTSIMEIGGTGSFEYKTHSDFSSVDFVFVPIGTQSVYFQCIGQTSQNLDWDIYINYTKSFHTLSSPTPDKPKPIYPKFPDA